MALMMATTKARHVVELRSQVLKGKPLMLLAVMMVMLIWLPMVESAAEIYYVMEPFEDVDAPYLTLLEGDGDSLVMSSVEQEALYGRRALRIKYDYSMEAKDDEAVALDEKTLKVGFHKKTFLVGRMEPQEGSHPHNCLGATHMALSVKVKKATDDDKDKGMQLRLVLVEDRGQEEGVFESLPRSLTALKKTADQEEDWEELQFPFEEFSATGGEGDLDLSSIRGWWLELTTLTSHSITNTTTTLSTSTILFDQLQCVGDERLLGVAFRLPKTFEEAVQDGSWYPQYFESPLAENQTSEVLEDGRLKLDYTVQQAESWGGFTGYDHIAAGPAYYNLSQASMVEFDYHVGKKASDVDRVHLALVLFDISDCLYNCNETRFSEHYYAFFFMLEEQGPGTIQVELNGDAESTSPFWRPGWDGTVGNNVLDKEFIKGFFFEININSQGAINSTTSGQLTLGNFSAKDGATNIDHTDYNEKEKHTCVIEEGLIFNFSSPVFTRFEFESECCERCLSDEEGACMYAFYDGRDCYMAAYLDHDSFAFAREASDRDKITAFSNNVPEALGDICKVCDCSKDSNGDDHVIDCRGKDLPAVPRLSAESSFRPRVLDLRENPRLGFIGKEALTSVALTLEELYLPKELSYISTETITNMEELKLVKFENGQDVGKLPRNVIKANSGVAGFFGDVCCSLGETVQLETSGEGLTFCDMKVAVPGADATYEPYKEIFRGDRIKQLTPSSAFLAEAAESAQKCAEFCTLSEECRYFSYDARVTEAEHRCYLYRTAEVTEQVCCEWGDYADEEQTLPGWTSGRPPRTRHELDNAKVLLSDKNLHVSRNDGYKTQFNISLGSTPLRGAVWIEPKLASLSQSIDAVISPSRVALYDDATVATVTVTITNPEAVITGDRLTITCSITSCDAAYTADTVDALVESSTLHIDVVPVENTDDISTTLKVAAIVIVGIQAALSLFFMAWTVYFRDHAVISKSQPIFLAFVAIGCLVTSLSILPTMVEGTCMAFPWLFNLGFIITFSALFAKIWRIRRLLKSAMAMRRQAVLAKDVAVVMVALTFVQFAILLTWQLVSPLQWEREVVKMNDQGHTLESHGYCTSSHAMYFLVPITVFDFSCLMYALYLCYITRELPSDFNEAKWITASILSILQALVVAVPTLFIAFQDTNAFFFLRASIVSIVSLAVLCFIFLPKLVVVHGKKPTASRTSSMFSPSRNTRGSGVSGLSYRPSQDASSPFYSPSTDSGMNVNSKYTTTRASRARAVSFESKDDTPSEQQEETVQADPEKQHDIEEASDEQPPFKVGN